MSLIFICKKYCLSEQLLPKVCSVLVIYNRNFLLRVGLLQYCSLQASVVLRCAQMLKVKWSGLFVF